MSEWEMRDGRVVVCPLVGWASGIAPMTGFLRLEFARSDHELLQQRLSHLQLVLTEKQLRELGEHLLKMADRLEDQPRGEGTA